MRKMLIAVDSRIITEELERRFQNDYQIFFCRQGNDALQFLQQARPDVLIIMLSLPGITGMKVLQETKYTPPVIIALTDYLSEHVVQEAQTAGVGALIRLPCSIDYISHHLNALLAQSDNLPSS